MELNKLKGKASIVALAILIITLPTIIHFAYQAGIAQSATIIFEHPIGTASIIIWRDGSTYYAKDNVDGSILFSGTNATTVVNNALLSQGLIHFGQGIFVVDMLLIPNNTILEGEGYNTVIQLRDGANQRVISNLNWQVGGSPGGDPNTNIVIRNLRVDGNKANNAQEHGGISMYYLYDVTIENIWIHDNDGYGAICIGASGTSQPAVNAKIRYVRAWNNEDKDGNYGSAIFLTSYLVNRSEVIGCTLWDNENGIVIEDAQDEWSVLDNKVFDSGTNIWLANVTDGIVSKNILRGGTRGIGGSDVVQNVIIDDNIISLATYEGIKLTDADNCTISNNRIFDNVQIGWGAMGAGLDLTNSSFNLVVGNNINDPFPNTQYYGILEQGALSDYNQFGVNMCLDPDGVGIAVTGANTRVTDSWNGTVFIRFYNSTTLETG